MSLSNKILIRKKKSKFHFTENKVSFFFYDEPELREDIKSIKDSDVITESHFEQECIIRGMAPIRSKYRSTIFRVYFAILFIIFPPNGATSA